MLSHFFSQLTREVTKGHRQAQIYRLGESEAHSEWAICSRSDYKEESGSDSEQVLRFLPPAPPALERHHTSSISGLLVKEVGVVSFQIVSVKHYTRM